MVCGLVQQQEVGVAGEAAGERTAGELAAAEGVERAVEVFVVEAQSADGGHRLLAPVVAAGVLEPGLRPGIAVEHGLVAGGHLLL